MTLHASCIDPLKLFKRPHTTRYLTIQGTKIKKADRRELCYWWVQNETCLLKQIWRQQDKMQQDSFVHCTCSKIRKEQYWTGLVSSSIIYDAYQHRYLTNLPKNSEYETWTTCPICSTIIASDRHISAHCSSKYRHKLKAITFRILL